MQLAFRQGERPDWAARPLEVTATLAVVALACDRWLFAFLLGFDSAAILHLNEHPMVTPLHQAVGWLRLAFGLLAAGSVFWQPTIPAGALRAAQGAVLLAGTFVASLLVDRSVISDLFGARLRSFFDATDPCDSVGCKLIVFFAYCATVLATLVLLAHPRRAVSIPVAVVCAVTAATLMTCRSVGVAFTVNVVDALGSTLDKLVEYSGPFVWRALGYLIISSIVVTVMRVCLRYLRLRPSTHKALVAAGVCLAALGISLYSRGRVTSFAPPVKVMAVAFNAVALAPRDEARASIELAAPSEPDLRTIILVVDESVSNDLLSLAGFPLPTTPKLQQLAARITNYGTATALTRYTHTTHYLLQRGVRREAAGYLIPRVSAPTIFQYAKRAGFRVFFLDGQHTSASASGHLVADYDLAHYVDRYFSTREEIGHGDYRDDVAINETIRALLDAYRSEKVFIYVVKRGLHFPFRDNHPPSDTFFSAAQPGEPLSRDLADYLNGLRWSVDLVLDDLLRVIEGRPDTAVLYTADHGLRLLGPLSSDPEVAHRLTYGVPLLLLHPFPVQGEAPGSAGHAQIVPTLLVWLGYDDAQVHALYGPDLGVRDAGVQRFITGDIFGRAERQEIPLPGSFDPQRVVPLVVPP